MTAYASPDRCEATVTTLARRLVRVDASRELVAAVGEAFGPTTEALLDEMARLREPEKEGDTA